MSVASATSAASAASAGTQFLNFVLAMGLGALATAASLELRSAPVEPTGVQAPVTTESAGAAPEPVNPLEDVALPVPAVPPPLAPILAQTSAATAAPGATAAPAPAAEAAPASRQAVAGAARSAAPAVEAKLAALPKRSGVIFEEAGKKACIGGTLCTEHCKAETGGCGVRPAYTIKLDRPAYLSAVQLYAHDQVGPSRRARLLVKVDGEAVAGADVYRFGSTLTFKIGRVGQLVTVESMHQHHGFLNGGEEAVIWDVYLFGREPR